MSANTISARRVLIPIRTVASISTLPPIIDQSLLPRENGSIRRGNLTSAKTFWGASRSGAMPSIEYCDVVTAVGLPTCGHTLLFYDSSITWSAEERVRDIVSQYLPYRMCPEECAASKAALKRMRHGDSYNQLKPIFLTRYRGSIEALPCRKDVDDAHCYDIAAVRRSTEQEQVVRSCMAVRELREIQGLIAGVEYLTAREAAAAASERGEGSQQGRK